VSKEFASDGIAVNAYSPGVVGSDMWVEIDRRMAEITGATIGASYENLSAASLSAAQRRQKTYRFRLLSGGAQIQTT